MDVFFKTENGLKFRIELGYWDTVLDIKKKIKKYKRIILISSNARFSTNLESKSSSTGIKFFNRSSLQCRQNQLKISFTVRICLLTTKNFEPIKIYLPPEKTKGIINCDQESTVTVQTKESQASSSKSVKKYKKNQDSRKNVPMKRLALCVLLPYSGSKNFTVFVRRKDQVRKLRTLVQNRVRDQAWIRDGYFFNHRERILYEDESFEWNGVDRFSSTINIVPGPWFL